jgi:hypothetical protein
MSYRNRCPWIGIQAQCSQEKQRDSEYCYYHTKIAMGLTTQYEDTDYQFEEME